MYQNHNGLYIKQSDIKISEKDKSKSDASILTSLGDIVVEKCVFFSNFLSGIHIKNILNSLYLKQSPIKENKNFAIFVQNQEEMERLVLRDKEKGKTREYINGNIGGSWGFAYEQNVKACTANKCMIF
jgi:hypothetical protein